MRARVRIVGGDMRGRKLTCNVDPNLRPTPDRVREALFNILGNAVPDRVFVDVFAGTGVVGTEALSRSASQVLFIERDVKLAGDLEKNLSEFRVQKQSRIYRTDAYRWVSHWQPPAEPVNVFLSPPFADLAERTDDLVHMIEKLQANTAADSLIILQAETHSPIEELSFLLEWERRKYGRNVLYIWQKAELPAAAAAPEPGEPSAQEP